MRKVSQDVQVDIQLKDSIDRVAFTKLLTDLAKHLLLLKNQIPLQFEAIAREVELDDKTSLAGGLEETEDEEEEERQAPSREDVRRRQQRARERRSKAHLLKNGRKFLSDFSAMARSLEMELQCEDIVSVSFLFGATCHSAREVYTVQVPPFQSSEGSGEARPGLQLYRAMLGHQELAEVTDRRLPVSNMMTVLARRSLPVLSASLHLPDFSLPPLGRTARVFFTLTGKAGIRKLDFNSAPETDTALGSDTEIDSGFETAIVPDLETEDRLRMGEECQGTPAVCRDPVSMELCTPCPPTTSRNYQPPPEPDCMELCTPVPVQGIRRRQELSLGGLSLSSPEKRSRRSSTEQEQLHWFLLDSSIRGFRLKTL